MTTTAGRYKPRYISNVTINKHCSFWEEKNMMLPRHHWLGKKESEFKFLDIIIMFMVLQQLY